MSIDIKSGKDLLKMAIKGEQDGLRFYSFLADRADNSDAKMKLTQLADDEKRHSAILTEIYINLYNEEVGELPEKGINALAKIFDGRKACGKSTEMQFIDMAIEAELAATKFYKEFAAGFEDEKIRKICADLATEEYSHYELLQAEKSSLAGTYYWFDVDGASPMED